MKYKMHNGKVLCCEEIDGTIEGWIRLDYQTLAVLFMEQRERIQQLEQMIEPPLDYSAVMSHVPLQTQQSNTTRSRYDVTRETE